VFLEFLNPTPLKWVDFSDPAYKEKRDEGIKSLQRQFGDYSDPTSKAGNDFQ
jgi:hypothetical protein